METTLEFHLEELPPSWTPGASRDPTHLLPGALGQSRAGKPFISIKSYCDVFLVFFCSFIYLFIYYYLFQVKPSETHLVLEFELFVQVCYLRYKFNEKTCSLLNPPNFVMHYESEPTLAYVFCGEKLLEIPQYFKIF